MGVRISRPADMATPIGGNHGAGSVSADVGSQIPAVRRLFRDQPAEPDPGCDEHRSGSRADRRLRSEEHTSELQSLMRISYAVFCLKKQKQQKRNQQNYNKHIKKI